MKQSLAFWALIITTVMVYAADKYKDNGNGIVTDTKTKLEWQKCSMGQNNDVNCSGEATKVIWKKAVDYCKRLTLANKKWRLPKKEELKTLVYCSNEKATEKKGRDYCKKNNKLDYSRPTIDQKLFPNTGLNGAYWSVNTSSYGTSYAWYVTFGNGVLNYAHKFVNPFYVRCVSTDAEIS